MHISIGKQAQRLQSAFFNYKFFFDLHRIDVMPDKKISKSAFLDAMPMPRFDFR
jgi:hypothetical protein